MQLLYFNCYLLSLMIFSIFININMESISNSLSHNLKSLFYESCSTRLLYKQIIIGFYLICLLIIHMLSQYLLSIPLLSQTNITILIFTIFMIPLYSSIFLMYYLMTLLLSSYLTLLMTPFYIYQ